MAEIRLSGVNKVYPGGTHAVHDVDLHIADGEFMIMVGPSGCAKSTILRMIAGLETPSGGTIEIGGRVVNDVAPKDRDIAMVFQSYALYPHMTVRENMAFGLRLRRMAPTEIDQRVAEAARILGLEQLLDRLPKAMSGGQRQRVAMGRAIVREPQAFLMDEPLSNLDAKLRVQMRTEIAKLHQRLSTTTVYVTHDQVEAMTLGQRICILRKGVVQQVDTPFQVYTNPANVFVGGFMGSPGMNFMTGHLMLHDGMVFLRVGDQHLPVPASVTSRLTATTDLHGRGVIVGIRPEHLTLSTEADQGAIQVQVELTEAMGSEVYAYFTAAVATPDLRELSDTQATADTFVARLASGTETRGGERIMLRPDMDEVHLFDAQSMLTLLAPADEADVRARQSGNAIQVATGVAGTANSPVTAPPATTLLQPMQPVIHLHQTIMHPEPTFGTLAEPVAPAAIASVFDQPVASPFAIEPLVVGASPTAMAADGGSANPHAYPRPSFAPQPSSPTPAVATSGPYARLGMPGTPSGPTMDWGATPPDPVEPGMVTSSELVDPVLRAEPVVQVDAVVEEVEPAIVAEAVQPTASAPRGFAPRVIGAPSPDAAAVIAMPPGQASPQGEALETVALEPADLDAAIEVIEQVDTPAATPAAAPMTGFAPLGTDAVAGSSGFREALAQVRAQRARPAVAPPKFGSGFQAPRISIDSAETPKN